LKYSVYAIEIKKGGIAPLQPAALAAFRPWGSSRGAGRTATAKIGVFGRRWNWGLLQFAQRQENKSVMVKEWHYGGLTVSGFAKKRISKQ
jgi:hypothetical protein